MYVRQPLQSRVALTAVAAVFILLLLAERCYKRTKVRMYLRTIPYFKSRALVRAATLSQRHRGPL